MKNILFTIFLSLAAVSFMAAEDLVILHTNDTHSNIDPSDKGVGGILQRKAVIDSVRKAEKNVLLVDAGDMVQGTLYFNYFKGDVEYPLFNMMGYDVRILGNHEFDNGLDELAKYWKGVKGSRLSANYDFTGTPAQEIFQPYAIKKVGKHKVGFIGINVDPKSLISEENYEGMKYEDPVEAANRAAKELRKKGCDLVVAVTHIGYEPDGDKIIDPELAEKTRGIDVIIGGHSHTVVDPKNPATPHWFKNADGVPVLVTQTGRYGANLGYIKIDMDDLKDHDDKHYDYELIPVTDRFPESKLDKKMEAYIAPYRAKVDSINHVTVAYSRHAMENVRKASAYANWAGDFAQWYGTHIADSLRAAGHDVPAIDFSMMNVGGIRQPMPEGKVSQGLLLSAFPFSNKLRIITIKGKDLLETMKIVAPKGGEAISREAVVVTDGKGGVRHFLIGGKEVDPEKNYTVCTIDYVAEGNDDMLPMKNHREHWRDSEMVNTRIIEYAEHLTRNGLAIDPDPVLRFTKDVTLEYEP